MRILLDTHAFLWAATRPSRLGADCRHALVDETNELLFSIASLWEMSIKESIGKLRLSTPFERLLDEGRANLGYTLLPVEVEHVLRIRDLPFHHRDPFDRLLVSQALTGGLAVASADAVFDMYGVKRVW